MILRVQATCLLIAMLKHLDYVASLTRTVEDDLTHFDRPQEHGPKGQKARIVRDTLQQLELGTGDLFMAAARVREDNSEPIDTRQTRGQVVPRSENLVYRRNSYPSSDYSSGVADTSQHIIRHRHRARTKPAQSQTLYSVQRPDTNRCPHSGMLRCPSLRLSHKPQVSHNTCIKRQQLCDGFRNCPNGEDEDDVACLFYRATRKVLSQAWDLIEDISQQFNEQSRSRGRGRWRRHRFRRKDSDEFDLDDEL